MSKRWAFLLAVGNPRYAGIGGPSHVDADVAALSNALVISGFPIQQQTVLIGPDATKAVVESRSRSIMRRIRKGDSLFVFAGSRIISIQNQLYLSCWDTLPDDPIGTGLLLEKFLDDFSSNKIESPVCLLDLVLGPKIQEEDEEIAALPETQICGLLSCEIGETSHTTGSPPRGLWEVMITDILSGKQFGATETDGSISIQSLDAYLNREFPRRLRAAFGPGSIQTPRRFGSQSKGIIKEKIDGSHANSNPFDAGRFSRIVFRGESRLKVKDLSGYRKSFAIPDRVTPSANKFIARLATADVENDLRDTFDRVVREYGYKRRDVSVETDREGNGTLRTPDFEFAVHVELDENDPSFVQFHREISQFQDPATVRSPAFDACFGRVVDRLAFEFETPWNVTAFVDQFEDQPIKGTTIRTSPDGTSCVIQFSGMEGSIELNAKGLNVRGRSGSPGDLLASLFQFFKQSNEPIKKMALTAKRKNKS